MEKEKRKKKVLSSVNRITDILDGSRETLVPLRIVVLQTDLKFDCLDEVAFFLAGCFDKHLFDRAPHA